VTEESYWYSHLESRAAAEADIIVRKFRERGIEIGGEADPADQDRDVTPNGIRFMYAKGQLLTREQYLGGVGGIRGIQNVQSANRQRGVLDILQENGVVTVEVIRVVRDILLLRLNPHRTKEASESSERAQEGNDGSPAGNGRTSGDSGGTPEGHEGITEGEPPDVLHLLNLIDRELGPGIATPDHVLTAANGSMSPCSATEPQPPFRTAGPDPAVCRGDGGARVRIFIADTGLLPDAAETFPWLHGAKTDTDDLRASGGTILPYAGHGTFVAGVLRCMAPEAEIRVANIFDTAGSALESDFVLRLNAAFGFGFEILHLTASCMTRNNVQLIALAAWLDLLQPYKGVVCVAPAGNNDTRRPSWPGAFPEVISVGALAADWRSRAYFSDHGGWVDVYAPGQNLINAFATGTYTCKIPPNVGQVRTFSGLAQWSGTSFSAPIVTGLIAARMARRGESAREAASALLARARDRAIPGVGPVLLPSCGDEDDECRGGCSHDRCRGRCGCDRCRGG
jgi:subtilisin family serine protease